ncbi:GntR family transcriptional regulator [Streptomyces sp. NBC_01768]|uniref:GntR family transcriptional regulator n=1 Tax=Streptomyces sp. NBC_01768 TaxID=2975938 RepID=UPI002DDC763B|nr:GntR family transcriptional regulator [Streptomyces sp. NBC_01768]WSC32180.1 GntR family transcriptional regulator [Streptomyces sp. NBC_01768]
MNLFTPFAGTRSEPAPTRPAPPRAALCLPSPDPQLVDAVRERVTTGLYVPGSRLTLTELRDATGCDADALRPALDQLAATGIVKTVRGRWRVVDDLPAGHAARRAAQLLGTVIGQGGYPPDAGLPGRRALARILLAPADVVTQALALLADQHLLYFSGSSQPRVVNPPSGRRRTVWRERMYAIARKHPTRPRQSAPFNRPDIQAARDAAINRWRQGTCLPDKDMTRQERRQGEALERLASNACARAVRQLPHEHPGLRQAAVRVLACWDLPTEDVPLHERLYRNTVLATALADLADEIAAPSRAPQYPRR